MIHKPVNLKSKTGNVRNAGLDSKSGSLAWIAPKSQPQGPHSNQKYHHQQNHHKKELNPAEDNAAKVLLGELYEDRKYLHKFQLDKDFTHKPNLNITSLIDDALMYLDTRTEFWRQQKPVYSRRNLEKTELHKRIMIRNRFLIDEIAEDHKTHLHEAKEKHYNPKTSGGYVGVAGMIELRPASAPVRKSIIITSEKSRPLTAISDRRILPSDLNRPDSCSSTRALSPGFIKINVSRSPEIDQTFAASKISIIRSKRLKPTTNSNAAVQPSPNLTYN